MRRRSPARWWREQVSEIEAQRACWKPGVHGALGEPIHDLIAGVCVSQETYWLQREMGKSFLPPCLFWFSLFKILLGPAESLKLNEKGTSPADMDNGRSRSQPLCHLPCGSSLLPSRCFWLWASLQALPPSEALVPHPWLDHDWGSSLPDSPYWTTLRAAVWFRQQLTQASKDQLCAKERSSLWVGGQGHGSSVWVSRGQVHGKNPGTEEQATPEGTMGGKEETQRRKDGEHCWWSSG